MPAALTPSPLAGARDPLDGLRLRGWVHHGVLPLHGLLLDRRRVGPGWYARLLPWLDDAAEVRTHDDLVLVLFAEPDPRGGARRSLRDCAALGSCLPVLRCGAILATVPFAEPEPALAARLRDTLVHVAAGRVSAVPLAGFAPEDVAGWWALDAVVLGSAGIVPERRRTASRARRLVSAATTAVEAPPFRELQVKLARPPRRRLRDLLAAARRAAGRVGRLTLRLLGILLLIEVAAGLLIGLLEEATSVRRHSSAIVFFIVALTTALFAVRRTTGGGAAPSAAAGGEASQGDNRRAPFWRRVAAWLARRPTSRPIGGGSAPATSSAVVGTAVPAGSRRARLWRIAAGWLAWRSPYADRLRRRYAERLDEVERLFAAGRIDEALRKAIEIGGESEWTGASYADLPLSGPGLRPDLKIRFGRRPASGLTLDPAAAARLEALYRSQASELARIGDFERATFVLAELVAAPLDAVRLLADAGRHETAARLAEARRLGPVLFVPLWFKAGRPDRALALAARYDVFAELWKEVRPGDPFRDVLAIAWTDRLAATGAFGRAAALGYGVTALAERRRAWIRRALEAADPPRPEALVRALRALPWRADDNDPLHHAFAALLAEAGDERGENGPARRLAVAGHLVDHEFEGGPPKPATPAFALLSHSLARQLAVDEGVGVHDPERAGLAVRLVEAGQHVALRQHLRVLRRQQGVAATGPPRVIVVEAGPPLAAIADAVLLSHGRLLVGSRSGQLRLFGSGGRERWRGQVNGFLGFATVGAGDRALLLRGTLDGPAVLLFDPDSRRIEPRGILPVTNWHPHASETGWLVFDGEALTMLDTAALLAGPAEDGGAVHHWRVPVTGPGRALALADWTRTAALIHARADGLIEWWGIERSTLAVTCRFWTPPTVGPDADAEVLALADGMAWRLIPSADGRETELKADHHLFQSGDRATERDLLKSVRRDGPPARLPRLTGIEREKGWAAAPSGDAVLWRPLREQAPHDGVTMRWHGSSRLRTRFAPADTLAAVFDDLGRLVVLDVRTGRDIWRLR